jgi:hypothetical protein
MDGDSALETLQQDGCKPRLHELLVPATDGASSYGYLVVEASRSSFPEACRYIRDTRWLDSDLVPLLLSHFPLSGEETRRLPKRVPWFRAMPEVETQLQILRTALVVPLERRGLVCVDFAELVAILANGGEARLMQASGATTSIACDGLFAEGNSPEWLSAAKMAVSLHLRANPGFAMSEFDEAGRRLESFVAADSLVISSTNPWEGEGVEMTLLAVSARR